VLQARREVVRLPPTTDLHCFDRLVAIGTSVLIPEWSGF